MNIKFLIFTAAKLALLLGCAHDTRVGPLPALRPSPDKAEFIVAAAGDIACDPDSKDFHQGQGTERNCHMLATANLVTSWDPAAVLILGDSQYEKGTLEAFQKSWAHSWGRKELKDITYPSVGNHEYKTANASGYFDYFGARAGERDKGFYSFNLGTWHIIALNTGGNDDCKPISCKPGDAQEKWLKADLAKNQSACTLAFWHRPLFTSGLHRNATETRPFWQDLYDAQADVIVNGHSHHYERFVAQAPDGTADPARGLVQFVVGTGGKNLKSFWRAQRNSVVRQSKSYGVLKLELREKSYTWQFITENGEVLDSGDGQCHSKSSFTTPH
ncbi:MAG: metallophosphoesterase [Acidobacteria bacterium]|nr:metallophosphoesterase [Acidobacteriota bacterium]